MPNCNTLNTANITNTLALGGWHSAYPPMPRVVLGKFTQMLWDDPKLAGARELPRSLWDEARESHEGMRRLNDALLRGGYVQGAERCQHLTPDHRARLITAPRGVVDHCREV